MVKKIAALFQDEERENWIIIPMLIIAVYLFSTLAVIFR
jgi:hypothetical protein